MFACSHGVTGWGAENVIGWDLINVIFLTAFKVTPVGECGLTFRTQSEMSVPRKKKKSPGRRGIKSVRVENWVTDQSLDELACVKTNQIQGEMDADIYCCLFKSCSPQNLAHDL